MESVDQRHGADIGEVQTACSESCAKDGSCKLVAGKCVATVESCRLHDDCLDHGKCGVRDGVCIATELGCFSSGRCNAFGECSLDGEHCILKNDQDCQFSQFCVQCGRCTFSAKGCIATSVDDCLKVAKLCVAFQSLQIKDWAVHDGSCGPSDLFCQRQPECQEQAALCTGGATDCAASSSFECKVAGLCYTFGWCSFDPAGYRGCSALSDADCAMAYPVDMMTARSGYCLPRCNDDAACQIDAGPCSVAGLCSCNQGACIATDAGCANQTQHPGFAVRQNDICRDRLYQDALLWAP